MSTTPGLRNYTDALNAALIAAAITTEIAWPNRVYAPKKGVFYLDVQNAARTRTPLGAGRDSVELWQGVYQIGVMVSRDSGDRNQEDIASLVLNTFSRGTTLLTAAGNRVIVENSTAPGPVVFGDWSNMPVQVHWFATELPTF